MSPLEQGKYASYLYYHGLLDSEQFFILRDLEDTLIDMVSPYLALLVLKVFWQLSLQYIKLLYNCRFQHDFPFSYNKDRISDTKFA